MRNCKIQHETAGYNMNSDRNLRCRWESGITASHVVWTPQTGSGCVPQTMVCPHTFHQQAKVDGGREWVETCFYFSAPGIVRSGHLSSIRISLFASGIVEQQTTLRLPCYQRTYACLFSNSVPPQLNSGMIPRCAN